MVKFKIYKKVSSTNFSVEKVLWISKMVIEAPFFLSFTPPVFFLYIALTSRIALYIDGLHLSNQVKGLLAKKFYFDINRFFTTGSSFG